MGTANGNSRGTLGDAPRPSGELGSEAARSAADVASSAATTSNGRASSGHVEASGASWASFAGASPGASAVASGRAGLFGVTSSPGVPPMAKNSRSTAGPRNCPAGAPSGAPDSWNASASAWSAACIAVPRSTRNAGSSPLAVHERQLCSDGHGMSCCASCAPCDDCSASRKALRSFQRRWHSHSRPSHTITTRYAAKGDALPTPGCTSASGIVTLKRGLIAGGFFCCAAFPHLVMHAKYCEVEIPSQISLVVQHHF